MARRLSHRGPDEEGLYESPDRRCAIGFQRLSVIDPAGSHQPMSGPDGQVTVAFNGEIYNFRQLREHLADFYPFRTAGDTEVLLAAYLRWGSGMLSRLEGMFALAIHDRRDDSLLLARDRLGQKPLWYATLGDRIVFASEAKALRAHPQVAFETDPASLLHYLSLGYVPAPRAIWKGLSKLGPAEVVTCRGGAGEPERWWHPPGQIVPCTHGEAVERVRQVLIPAVEKRLVSDVPLGALLSGGIDSSIVAALMAQAGPVKTFCAGFTDAQFDERPFARRVAEHLGAEHREFLIEPAPGELLDTLIGQYDEPFADSSALPMVLLSRAVRQEVTVALCGDGGDEAFAGYDRHRAMWLAQTTGPLRSAVLTGLAVVADTFSPRDEKSKLRRFVRFARGLDAPPALRYLGYRSLFSQDQLAELLTDDLQAEVDPGEADLWFAELFSQCDSDSDLLCSQRHDVLTYLPDDLLVKADIASMSCGLELRAPMLDHAVIEAGLSLPDEWKVDRRGGKRILRDAFGHMLPREVFDRPKAGFGVPLGRWLAGPMLPMLRETLLDQSFIDAGWCKRTAMQRLIDQHAAGKADHRHRLWALLWLARWQAIR